MRKAQGAAMPATWRRAGHEAGPAGGVLARRPPSSPPAWHIERVLNPVEAGVLRPGEPPSLVVTDHAAYVAVWRYDPAHSDGHHFAFTKQFDRRMDACHRSPGMD